MEQSTMDLTTIIMNVIDQVEGSDDRAILDEWIRRNRDKEQIVTFELLPYPYDAQ